ncbi:MAG: hypothetical protein WA687_08455 [Solirubrobacterales bacterium]
MQVTKRLNILHFLLLVFGALLTLCAWLSGGPTEILGTLPAILLAVALAFNHYPGEELIARLAQRFRRPKPRPISVALPQRSTVALFPRLLLLAGVRSLRGPPLLS